MTISQFKTLWQDVEDDSIPADNITLMYLNEIDQTIYEKVRSVVPTNFISESTIAITSGGIVTNVSVGTAGTGYSVSDVLTLSNGNADCTVTVATIDTSGGVTSVTLTTAGTGYLEGSSSVTGGGGSNCLINVDRVLAAYSLPSDFENVNYPTQTGFTRFASGVKIRDYAPSEFGSQQEGYYIYDSAGTKKIVFTPTPTDTYTITVRYMPKKDMYTDDTDTLLLPDRWQKLYLDWFTWLYRTREDLRDPNTALMFADKGMKALLSQYHIQPVVINQHNATTRYTQYRNVR